MITIVDYGLGNLGSIANMLKKIGTEYIISSDLEVISKAQKILLPGVGAFDAAMKCINESGLKEVLDYKALVEKVPFLGICLGMQLLTEGSEEGELMGLCYIKGNTRRFKFTDESMKIPHMGWNSLEIRSSSSAIVFNMHEEEHRFYFVHSYFVKCLEEKNVIAQTNYGFYFDSVIQNDNVYGAQFHPEKSHRFGMKFLANFSSI